MKARRNHAHISGLLRIEFSPSAVHASELSAQPTPDNARELSLFDVARVMLSRWKIILAVVVVCTAVALAWSWRYASYRGEGVLQTPTISLADYKRYSIPLLDGPAFVA